MVEVYRRDLATSYTVENADVTDPVTGVTEFRDLAWYQARGYDTDENVQGTALAGTTSSTSSPGTAATSAEANQQAQALYSFMPQGVLDDFINNYIDTEMQILQ